jgi:hypothetical protein
MKLPNSFLKMIIWYINYKIIKNKVTPVTKCRLRLMKCERIKDYLLMEQEFIEN